MRDSPNLEGQVPVCISPRNRVAQLYPQALGSLHVVSYDSQGYGGGILTLPLPGGTGPSKSKVKSKSRYDRRPVNQYVLVPNPLGIKGLHQKNLNLTSGGVH
jgi:hypothetical protein